jgi:uncharacterized membrane protein YagU involved in acid resistance
MAEQIEQERRYLWGIDLKAAVLAGVVAGLVFLVLEMALLPLLGIGVWEPVRMIGAIVLGTEVLPPPATFSFGIFVVAMLVHLVLSIVYAFILSAIIRGRTQGVALAVGIVFGLVLYLVNFYAFTSVYPWFAEARNWVTLVAHLAFGLVAALIYVRAEVPRLVRRRTLEERPV